MAPKGIVEYSSGTPSEPGVYACRVPDHSGLWKDMFLMWYDKRWSYLGSDQYFRDPVPYWIGPLRRKMTS